MIVLRRSCMEDRPSLDGYTVQGRIEWPARELPSSVQRIDQIEFLNDSAAINVQ